MGKSSKYLSSQFIHVQESVFDMEFVSDIIMPSKAIDLQLVLKEIFQESQSHQTSKPSLQS